jgi:hypothetical protein
MVKTLIHARTEKSTRTVLNKSGVSRLIFYEKFSMKQLVFFTSAANSLLSKLSLQQYTLKDYTQVNPYGAGALTLAKVKSIQDQSATNKKSSSSEGGFQFFSTPPIKLLKTPVSIKEAIAQLKTNIEDFTSSYKTLGPLFGHECILMFLEGDYKHVGACTKVDPDAIVAAYVVKDQPVGLIFASRNLTKKSLKIDYIITHPGCKFAASALIEFVVQRYTVFEGIKGQAYLHPKFGSNCIYKFLGFIKRPFKDYMHLDALTSDKWYQNAEKDLCLTSNTGKRWMGCNM